MRRLFFNLICITFFVLFANPVWAAAGEIVVVQSSSLEPYEIARLSFEHHWDITHPRTGVKSIMCQPIAHFILSLPDSENNLKHHLKDSPPKVILAIGRKALVWCRDNTKLPVVFLMVPKAEAITGARKTITGINIDISPSRQLAAVKAVLPEVDSIGVLYNPKQTGYWVQDALLSEVNDVQTMVFRKINKATDFKRTLDSIGKSIDAYWMLPDKLVVTPQTIRLLLSYSLQNQIPLITFSEKYLKMGAAVAVTFDIENMSGQAMAMCNRIINGVPIVKITHEHPRYVRVIVNINLLEKMGIMVNRNALTEIFKSGDN